MTIDLIDEDGWGEGVVRYQWSGSGDELLLQLTESVRVYSVTEGVTEKLVIPTALDQVLNVGCAARGWWLLLRKDSDVLYRRDLQGQDLVLQDLSPKELSISAVSPDGKFIVGVVRDDTVSFWSTADGERIFGIRIDTEGDEADLLGGPGIASVGWAPGSRYLAVQPEFPMVGLMIVDVVERRLLRQVDRG